MSNPTPVMGREFLEQQFKRQFDEPLAKAGVCIRFKESVDKKLRAIAGYSDVVRTAVDQYFERIESGSASEPRAIADRETKSITQIEADGRPMEKVGTLVPATVHDLVESLPNRSEWLRRVITEAAVRELIKGDTLSVPKGDES
jgi:hypothetical protein